jgi:ribosomal protein S18 acetylase RimI-like enzyme
MESALNTSTTHETTLVRRELSELSDEMLLPWLALYETAFPASERILVADILALLHSCKCGPDANRHLVAFTDRRRQFVGLAYYEMMPEVSAACLWYLAVEPTLRGRGLGSRIYRRIVSDVKSRGAEAAVFEVEIPEQACGRSERRFARRRIAFYRRLGARLLTGIRYTQSVGSHQRPILMHVMVHPFLPRSSKDAFRVARAVLGEEVRRLRGKSLRLE